VSELFGVKTSFLVTWIAIGAAVGWLAESVTKYTRSGAVQDIAVGITGAVVAGLLLSGSGLPFDVPSVRTEQAIIGFVGAGASLLAMAAFERLS